MKPNSHRVRKTVGNPLNCCQAKLRRAASIYLSGACLLTVCFGQGTLTFTFEGQPRGTSQQYGIYSESGMQFGMVFGPGSVYLSGGGVPGYPDNGTGYLYMPDGSLSGLRFGFNVFQSTPSVTFNLVSFDAAEYAGLGAQTLEVVGYKYQIMGPIITVTNYFTLDGINDGTGPLQDFETFHPDSSFVNLFQVDVFNARWSLDNLVVSGVPEPSSGALLLLAGLCGLSLLRRCAGRS
jgi:hypothetical protein